MSEQAIVAIVLGILGMATGGGAWTYATSRKRAPIDAATAITAMAQTAQSMTLALVEQLQDQMDRNHSEYRSELARIREEHAADRTSLRTVQDQLQRFAETWAAWYRGLVEHWPTLRQSETAPDAPTMTPPAP